MIYRYNDLFCGCKYMPRPENKEDVRRFLGFVQYLAKFIDKLSEVDEPLRELTKKDVAFHWSQRQENSFRRLKKIAPKHQSLHSMMATKS